MPRRLFKLIGAAIFASSLFAVEALCLPQSPHGSTAKPKVDWSQPLRTPLKEWIPIIAVVLGILLLIIIFTYVIIDSGGPMPRKPRKGT